MPANTNVVTGKGEDMKRFIWLKAYFIAGTVFIGCASAQGQSNASSIEKTTSKTGMPSVFGMNVGTDSFDDLMAKAEYISEATIVKAPYFSAQEVCPGRKNTSVYNYGAPKTTVENFCDIRATNKLVNGEMPIDLSYFPENVVRDKRGFEVFIFENSSIFNATFKIKGNLYRGMFLDDILISADLIGQLSDLQTADLRKTLQHELGIPVQRTLKEKSDSGSSTTLEETWGRPSDSYKVVLSENKRKVTNAKICELSMMTIGAALAGTGVSYDISKACDPKLVHRTTGLRIAADESLQPVKAKIDRALNERLSGVRVPYLITPDECKKNVTATVAEIPGVRGASDIVGTTTILELEVSEVGVINSRIVKSSGKSRLDVAAMRAYGNCKYAPGIKDGKRADMWLKIEHVW